MPGRRDPGMSEPPLHARRRRRKRSTPGAAHGLVHADLGPAETPGPGGRDSRRAERNVALRRWGRTPHRLCSEMYSAENSLSGHGKRRAAAVVPVPEREAPGPTTPSRWVAGTGRARRTTLAWDDAPACHWRARAKRTSPRRAAWTWRRTRADGGDAGARSPRFLPPSRRLARTRRWRLRRNTLKKYVRRKRVVYCVEYASLSPPARLRRLPS